MRKLLITGALVLMLAFAFMISERAEAERPTGSNYSSTFAFYVNNDVTGTVSGPDTFQYLSGTSGRVFRFDDVKHYSTITGAYQVTVTGLDTGSSSTEILDTSGNTDTVRVIIRTADGALATQADVYTDTLNMSTDTTWHWFNIGDSTLAENVFFYVDAWCVDTCNSIAATDGIDYLIKVKMWAK